MNFSEKDLDQYIKKLKIEDGDTLFVDPGFVNIDEEDNLRKFIQKQVIDEYGKTHGYNFQHALNGGEKRILCYWVDGYDKENNVVIEYYEKKHDRKIEYDNKRMNRIIKFLKCKFVILKETNTGLKELVYE